MEVFFLARPVKLLNPLFLLQNIIWSIWGCAFILVLLVNGILPLESLIHINVWIVWVTGFQGAAYMWDYSEASCKVRYCCLCGRVTDLSGDVFDFGGVGFCASYWFVDPASLEEGLDWDTCCSATLSSASISSPSLLSSFFLSLSFQQQLFFSQQLIFSCMFGCFPMTQVKLVSSERLILTFIIVSFSFRVPVLVRFLK